MGITIGLGLIGALLSSAAQAATSTAQQQVDTFLATTTLTPASPDALDQRCEAALALAGSLRTKLEKRAGPSTIDADFRDYDAITNLLSSIDNEMVVVSSTNPVKAVREAADHCDSRMAGASTAISLSRPIYDRLATIPVAGLDAPDTYILAKTLKGYRLAGVDRDSATREKVVALQKEITDAGILFERNIAEDKSGITLASADDLAGLPQDYIDAHKPGPDGLIHISTAYPDVFPLLKFASREAVRKKMYMAFANRAWPVNEAPLKTLLTKRHELARLLGYPDYATLITADKMIGTPQHAAAFLDEVYAAALPSSTRDQAQLLAVQKTFAPASTTVEAWNNNYLANIVRTRTYDVDATVVRQYFTYAKARDGIFALIHDLFGADIRPWKADFWASDVEGYEIFDHGKLIGRFFLDMHPREGKFSHAETVMVRRGLDGRQLPIGGLLCNFPADGPMEHGDVNTFLHEFGHLIHFLYSGHQRFAAQSMDALQWDFVEAPSQLLEEWTWDYDTLSRFATNAKGEPIPAELVRKMNAARHFGDASSWRRQAGFSAASLAFHERAPGFDPDELWRASNDRYAAIATPPDAHEYAAFGHLNGYSAIYYTYVWSKAIALDLFGRFKAEGIRNPQVALAYRKAVLEPGGSADANTLIENFLGRPTNIDAFRAELRQ